MPIHAKNKGFGRCNCVMGSNINVILREQFIRPLRRTDCQNRSTGYMAYRTAPISM